MSRLVSRLEAIASRFLLLLAWSHCYLNPFISPNAVMLWNDSGALLLPGVHHPRTMADQSDHPLRGVKAGFNMEGRSRSPE